jgi:hypothetical protein
MSFASTRRIQLFTSRTHRRSIAISPCMCTCTCPQECRRIQRLCRCLCILHGALVAEWTVMEPVHGPISSLPLMERHYEWPRWLTGPQINIIHVCACDFAPNAANKAALHYSLCVTRRWKILPAAGSAQCELISSSVNGERFYIGKRWCALLWCIPSAESIPETTGGGLLPYWALDWFCVLSLHITADQKEWARGTGCVQSRLGPTSAVSETFSVLWSRAIVRRLF